MSSQKNLKVVAFNGSAKVNGNTAQLIEMVFVELRKAGIECKMITIGNSGPVQGCVGCGGCKGTEKCVRGNDKDLINSWYQEIKEADGLILGSPTQFSTVSVEMKALMDRCGQIAFQNGRDKFCYKVAAAVVAVRRGGGTHTFDCMNHFFLDEHMIVVGSSYWNDSVARLPGEVQNDEEGKRTMCNLGKNMAYVLQKIHATASADVTPPKLNPQFNSP